MPWSFERTDSGNTWVRFREHSFLATPDQMQALADRRMVTLEDCSNRITLEGDSLVFWNAPDFGRSGHGEATIRWERVYFPRRAWRVVARYLRRKLSEKPRDWQRVIIPDDAIGRLCRRYGQGKGRVRLDASLETLARVKACKGTGLAKQVAYLVQGERNRTESVYQKPRRVKLWADLDGFDFEAFGFYGGIVDHGRRTGSYDWSIHT